MDLDQYRELAKTIKAKVDIAELIAEHTTVRAQGKESVAKCTFHDDKTPSMSINSEKGLYCCRGCGAAGDIIKFQSEITGASMGEAIIALAKKYGIPIPKGPEKSGSDYTRRDLELLSRAADNYSAMLSTQDGCDALTELHRRGVSDATIKRFSLGYGGLPGEKPACLISDNEKAQFVITKSSLRTGIVSEKRWHYMSDRIVFPIRDEQGAVRGFGGRKIEHADGGNPDSPKYLNTPETPYFKKGGMLYGAHEAKQAIRQTRQAILVEGYMDVVISHQEGFQNTLGAMSASIDEGTISRLWRSVNDLVICLDGDPAGLRGAMNIIESAASSYTEGKTIRVAILPDGIDPDQFLLEKGREAYQALIDEAIPASKFAIRYLSKQCDMTCAEGRAAFIKKIDALGAKFANSPIFQDQLNSQARLHADLRAFASAVAYGFNQPLDNEAALNEIRQFRDRLDGMISAEEVNRLTSASSRIRL